MLSFLAISAIFTLCVAPPPFNDLPLCSENRQTVNIPNVATSDQVLALATYQKAFGDNYECKSSDQTTPCNPNYCRTTYGRDQVDSSVYQSNCMYKCGHPFLTRTSRALTLPLMGAGCPTTQPHSICFYEENIMCLTQTDPDPFRCPDGHVTNVHACPTGRNEIGTGPDRGPAGAWGKVYFYNNYVAPEALTVIRYCDCEQLHLSGFCIATTAASNARREYHDYYGYHYDDVNAGHSTLYDYNVDGIHMVAYTAIGLLVVTCFILMCCAMLWGVSCLYFGWKVSKDNKSSSKPQYNRIASEHDIDEV